MRISSTWARWWPIIIWPKIDTHLVPFFWWQWWALTILLNNIQYNNGSNYLFIQNFNPLFNCINVIIDTNHLFPHPCDVKWHGVDVIAAHCAWCTPTILRWHGIHIHPYPLQLKNNIKSSHYEAFWRKKSLSKTKN